VSELRHRFAGKNVRLTFNGDSNVLKAAIENMAIILGEGEKTSFDDSQSLIVDMHNGVQRRDLIAAANNAVDLIGFEPMLPSMDNIFIQAVNAASKR
jgi:hypothetical protein